MPIENGCNKYDWGNMMATWEGYCMGGYWWDYEFTIYGGNKDDGSDLVLPNRAPLGECTTNLLGLAAMMVCAEPGVVEEYMWPKGTEECVAGEHEVMVVFENGVDT